MACGIVGSEIVVDAAGAPQCYPDRSSETVAFTRHQPGESGCFNTAVSLLRPAAPSLLCAVHLSSPSHPLDVFHPKFHHHPNSPFPPTTSTVVVPYPLPNPHYSLPTQTPPTRPYPTPYTVLTYHGRLTFTDMSSTARQARPSPWLNFLPATHPVLPPPVHSLLPHPTPAPLPRDPSPRQAKSPNQESDPRGTDLPSAVDGADSGSDSVPRLCYAAE